MIDIDALEKAAKTVTQLLKKVEGPDSFDDWRNYNNNQYKAILPPETLLALIACVRAAAEALDEMEISGHRIEGIDKFKAAILPFTTEPKG